MDAARRLFSIEAPLAIGSTVLAKGLGEVIIAGPRSSNTAVAPLAILLHDALVFVERQAARRAGR